MKKVKTVDKIFIGLIFAFLGICACLLTDNIKSRFASKEVTKIKDTVIVCQEDSFTVRDFVLELHLQKIQYPDIILRQACLESNFFKSVCWRKKNNPFGFCGKDGYIIFNDWRSAISYMKEWQDKYYKGSGSYYDFLSKRGYAIDSNYVSKLKALDISDLRNIK